MWSYFRNFHVLSHLTGNLDIFGWTSGARVIEEINHRIPWLVNDYCHVVLLFREHFLTCRYTCYMTRLFSLWNISMRSKIHTGAAVDLLSVKKQRQRTEGSLLSHLWVHPQLLIFPSWWNSIGPQRFVRTFIVSRKCVLPIPWCFFPLEPLWRSTFLILSEMSRQTLP